MNKLLKITSILTTGLLLQACAPNNGEAGRSDTWWRVTPVDISEGGAEILAADTEIAPVAGAAPVAAPVAAAPQQSVSVDNTDNTTIPVYRYASAYAGGIRLLSTETSLTYWRNEGEKFAAFNVATAGRLAIYNCVAGNDYFTSPFENCEGRQKLGRIGYIERTASASAPRALYRCTGPRGGHMDSTDANECLNNGFYVEATLGFVK